MRGVQFTILLAVVRLNFMKFGIRGHVTRDVNKAGSFKAKAKAKSLEAKAKARSLKAKTKAKARDQG